MQRVQRSLRDLGTNHKNRGFGGFPIPWYLIKNLFSRLFPTKIKQKIARTMTIPSATLTQADTGPGTYVTFEAVVGRNSTFHQLTKDQREELGGVEYRALNVLLWLIPIVSFEFTGSVRYLSPDFVPLVSLILPINLVYHIISIRLATSLAAAVPKRPKTPCEPHLVLCFSSRFCIYKYRDVTCRSIHDSFPRSGSDDSCRDLPHTGGEHIFCALTPWAVDHFTSDNIFVGNLVSVSSIRPVF
jgi:hypothetical protein